MIYEGIANWKCNYYTWSMKKKTAPTPINVKKGVKNKGKAKITSTRAIRMIERQYQVLKLRKEGLTIHAIAEQLKINDSAVREALKLVLERISTALVETVEESRQLQVERLDALLLRYMPLAESGNLSAASMVLMIEARRSKLLALDTPETKRIETTGIREYIGVDLDKV